MKIAEKFQFHEIFTKTLHLEENPVFLDVCLGLKLGAARPRKSFEKIKQNGRFSRPGAFEVEADLRLKIIQQTWRHL